MCVWGRVVITDETAASEVKPLTPSRADLCGVGEAGTHRPWQLHIPDNSQQAPHHAKKDAHTQGEGTLPLMSAHTAGKKQWWQEWGHGPGLWDQVVLESCHYAEVLTRR